MQKKQLISYRVAEDKKARSQDIEDSFENEKQIAF